MGAGIINSWPGPYQTGVLEIVQFSNRLNGDIKTLGDGIEIVAGLYHIYQGSKLQGPSASVTYLQRGISQVVEID